MKRQILLYILLLTTTWLAAQTSMRIGVITDTHYLSPALMERGKALDDYISASGKNVEAVPDVLSKVLHYYTDTAKVDVLLVTGDLTKDGEKQSHLHFAELLNAVSDAGVKVFVIPGNHDVNMPNAQRYTREGTAKVDHVSASEFSHIYARHGYGDALNRDANSLSYVAELDGDTWLLAIDAARYDEYTDRSITEGRIKKSTEQWMLSVLDDAKRQNKSVIAMMHWGVVEHIMYQSQLFARYLVDDWQRIANLLADNGVRVVFTGHFHATDITKFTSDAGNELYDVETGTLSGYPYAYRVIDCQGDSMHITTRNVRATANYPNLRADDLARMQPMALAMAHRQLKAMGFLLPNDVSDSMAAVAARIFLMHLQGDEVMDDELRKAVRNMARVLDSDMEIGDIELDFYPNDNETVIRYRSLIFDVVVYGDNR